MSKLAPRCANCRFWDVWRQVMLADDEPKMLGHCVITCDVSPMSSMTIVQGLTAEDFHCRAWKEPAEAHWCTTCGLSTPKGVTECETCRQWWKDNPPPGGDGGTDQPA